MLDRESVKALVQDQLALIRNEARKRALQAILVEPRMEDREWDYGEAGERYRYWVVAEESQSGVILVYCEQGFGPESPWGFLLTRDDQETTLGMDSQWNWYLEKAFIRAGLWAGETFRNEPWHLPPEIRFKTPGDNSSVSG